MTGHEVEVLLTATWDSSYSSESRQEPMIVNAKNLPAWLEGLAGDMPPVLVVGGVRDGNERIGERRFCLRETRKILCHESVEFTKAERLRQNEVEERRRQNEIDEKRRMRKFAIQIEVARMKSEREAERLEHTHKNETKQAANLEEIAEANLIAAGLLEREEPEKSERITEMAGVNNE